MKFLQKIKDYWTAWRRVHDDCSRDFKERVAFEARVRDYATKMREIEDKWVHDFREKYKRVTGNDFAGEVPKRGSYIETSIPPPGEFIDIDTDWIRYTLVERHTPESLEFWYNKTIEKLPAGDLFGREKAYMAYIEALDRVQNKDKPDYPKGRGEELKPL